MKANHQLEQTTNSLASTIPARADHVPLRLVRFLVGEKSIG